METTNRNYIIYRGKKLIAVRTKLYPTEIGYTDGVKTYCATATPAYFVVYPEPGSYISKDSYWGYFDCNDCEFVGSK